MVDEIEGVVTGDPVPIFVPPDEASHQLSVPALAVAASETVPVPQREPGVDPVIVGKATTVTVAVDELAEEQEPL